MRISVDGGSFNVAIETEFSGLITEITDIYQETLDQVNSSDLAVLRFLQIIIENSENDDAIGYSVLGLLGWYNTVIGPVENKDIELNLPKILPHLINPAGDLNATCDTGNKTFLH
jgi:hypothetical protein